MYKECATTRVLCHYLMNADTWWWFCVTFKHAPWLARHGTAHLHHMARQDVSIT